MLICLEWSVSSMRRETVFGMLNAVYLLQLRRAFSTKDAFG